MVPLNFQTPTTATATTTPAVTPTRPPCQQISTRNHHLHPTTMPTMISRQCLMNRPLPPRRLLPTRIQTDPQPLLHHHALLDLRRDRVPASATVPNLGHNQDGAPANAVLHSVRPTSPTKSQHTAAPNATENHQGQPASAYQRKVASTNAPRTLRRTSSGQRNTSVTTIKAKLPPRTSFIALC